MQTYHTNITQYCFLPGGAIYKTTNGTDELLFTYTDHIGSITHITDNEGNLLVEQSFDAWGRARNPETWKYETIINNQYSIVNSRGYTGHEMLPEFGLINMNGRLYDPVLGRMLSPDNYIQMPDYTQNFNRYSYVLNNPLKYTDPDGEIAMFVPIIVGAAIGAYQGYKIGKAAGANEFGEWAAYIGGGALIGAGIAYGAYGLSLAGAAPWTIGAAAGAGSSASYTALAGGSGKEIAWNGFVGAASGFMGGVMGSAVATGYGTGAFVGGTTSNIMSQLLNNKGNFNEIDWASVSISGASSFGMYHAMSFSTYKWGGGHRLGHIDVNYRQYCKINAAYQHSRFWKKEIGVYINTDGSARFVPRNDRHKFSVTFDDFRVGDIATVHTHWAKAGVDWVDIRGAGTRYKRLDPTRLYPAGSKVVTTVAGHHSPGDMNIPGFSIVVGRATSTYSIGGTGIYHYFTPDPFIRFFNFN